MREDARKESPRNHPRESSFINLMSGWAQQGVQSYFATQRILMDLAMRQNSSLMYSLKERLSDPLHSPTHLLTELADEGVSNLVGAHKIFLDLAQRQNDIVMSGLKERVRYSSPAVAIADLLRRSLDIAIHMQQDFLHIAGQHSHSWIESAKAGKTLQGDSVIELAREAMDKFVHAEKQLLDAIADETTKATRKTPAGAKEKSKKTELAELASRATESFIEAQKRLVDVAGRQVDANLKTASRTMDLLKPLEVMPLSDWTREGVKNFVDAQKALMEAVTKPRNGSPVTGKTHRTPPRPRRTKPRPRAIPV
jgi:hypothetical protein